MEKMSNCKYGEDLSFTLPVMIIFVRAWGVVLMYELPVDVSC